MNTLQRRRLPETRMAVTHKFTVGGQKGYVNVGLFEDGTVGEIFCHLEKTDMNGMMDVLCITASMALQRGAALEDLCSKWEHQRFPPAGPTKNKAIPMALSIPDYLGRWLRAEFCEKTQEAGGSNGKYALDSKTV